jgi:hypothetical protein
VCDKSLHRPCAATIDRTNGAKYAAARSPSTNKVHEACDKANRACHDRLAPAASCPHHLPFGRWATCLCARTPWVCRHLLLYHLPCVSLANAVTHMELVRFCTHVCCAALCCAIANPSNMWAWSADSMTAAPPQKAHSALLGTLVICWQVRKELRQRPAQPHLFGVGCQQWHVLPAWCARTRTTLAPTA